MFLLVLQAAVHSIVREAVELEHEFCCEALSCALVGMNAKLMGQYIDYVADRLLVALGYEKMYNTANPFDWMEMISLQVPFSAMFAGSVTCECCLGQQGMVVVSVLQRVLHAEKSCFGLGRGKLIFSRGGWASIRGLG